MDSGTLGERLHEAHRMVDRYVAEHPKLADTILVDAAARYRIDMLRGLLGLTAQAMHQLGVADDVARQVLRYVLHGGAPTHADALARQRELAMLEHAVSTAPIRVLVNCPCAHGGPCTTHPQGLPGLTSPEGKR